MADLPKYKYSLAQLVKASYKQRRFRLFLEGILVGLAAGFVGVGYRVLLSQAENWRNQFMNWVHTYPWWTWIAVLLAFISLGLIAAFLTRFVPEASGSGIPHLMAVLRREQQFSWHRIMSVKFVAGILAIGAGLSLGREGPTVQMGAAVGQAVSKALSRPVLEERYLIACGAGAGLSAAFNAPLSGVIFVLEELQKNFSPYLMGTVLAASLTADLISQYVLGPLPTFRVEILNRLPLSTLPLVIVISVLSGLLGVVFNYTLEKILALYDRVKHRKHWIRPLIACTAAGLIGYYIPQVLGGGHLLAEDVLSGRVAVYLIPLLFLSKFLLTMVSYGAGVPGGIFLPLLVLGAMAGYYFGHLTGVILPVVSGLSQSFAIVGMTGFFSAIVRAPITGMVLVVEMTGSFENMFSFMVASITAYALAEGLKSLPVYEMLLKRDLKKKKVELQEDESNTIFEFVVENGCKLEGCWIEEVPLQGCLFVSVRRGTTEFIPKGGTRFQSGDHVMILMPKSKLEVVRQMFRVDKSERGHG